MDLANHQQTPGNHIVPDCSSNGQLPDESYIEKLFPKCPPKQSQAKTMNNFRNLNGDKGGARQQHRRQNRSKFHQHHRREPLVADTATPTTRKDNSIQKPDINPSDLNNNSGKCNDIDYDSSSSGSTDKDIRANCESGYSGLKRSGSNQYGFDCKNRPNQADSLQSNGQQNNTANSSRQRARRYKATKNLQPRIRRSQSIQNRFNPPLLPLDPSKQLENDPSSTGTVLSDASSATLTATTMTSTTTTILAPISSEPAISTLISSQSNGNGSSMRTSMHGETSSLSNSSIKPKSFSTPEERRMDSKSINRTCRGIVFSEPLPTFNQANNTNEQLATSSTSILAANQQGAIESCSTAQLESSSPLMGPVAQMPPTLTTLRQEKGDEITADSSLNNTRLDTTKVAPQSVETVTETTIASPNLHDPVWENRRQLLTPIEDTNINNDGTSLMLEVDDNLKDDDKYINLFVYDNTGPHRKTSGTEVLDETKQRLDSPKQQQQDSKTPISDQYQPGHRLLTEDLSENEQDVIRNDTSTEELCSLADNDTENTKHKAAQKAVQSDFFSSIPEESIIGPEITTNSFVANKTHSKYHRPIGTLQTVDEKAELTADTDAVTADASNSSKIELIDIGGSSTMQSEDGLKILKKAGATPAPGFPRRVRSQLQPSINNNVEISPQVLPTTTMAKEHLQSTTGVDQSPAIKQTELTDSGPELLINSQTKNDTVDETEICQSSEQLALETDTNLSGALDKVSITKDSDTNSIDQTMFPSQYHKLPNESSHYSILRDMNKAQTIQTENVSVHRSRIHFNTLSDADSELDDQPNVEIRPNASSKTTTANSTDKKLDQIGETFTAGNSDTTRKIDDDLTPSNKTALIFPRLDEGLSSEAESCDDDIEEDDERAIEADVDADDEEGNDDDADSPTRSTNRSASVMLINVDQFLRQQQPQTSRTQNRLVGTSQQQQHPGINISGMQVVPDTDVQQIKQTSNSPYANFIGAHEPLDQTDLKSHPNYSNHNGQSNYWMGATSQTTMSAQPPASQNQQQFAIQRSQHHGNSNNGNDINMSRSNNYSNRDEAKTVNRLSSDTDNETDRLLGTQRNDQLQKMTNNELVSNNNSSVDSQTTNNFVGKQTSNSREVMIDGVLFNVKYLGSTHTECEGRGEKEDRIHQAELAVHEVKFRNGDSQAPVEVQLFISTEKIMVLDDKHRKIMMDHSLRTISYIADIGDAIVLIVRKKSTSMDTTNELGRPISKTSCHVFESNESHTITKSISQAFQVAYTELLKANGAGDTGSYLPKELDYQEVLNSQEMSTTELEMFARKDNQREVIVPKQEGEILGLSIVESGWGSVLPTAVIASLKQDGPAYRCKKLSVGDQILSINGISLVGLSLAECQKILRKTKSQSVARLSIVPCPITVEVKIKRPHTKYQLGFSVQHGVICSLLRGGIAERGGVRVGHRIISINGTTVVGVPHDKIVTLLASSVGEIRMKTCLTSLYRHILGEEKNVSFV